LLEAIRGTWSEDEETRKTRAGAVKQNQAARGLGNLRREAGDEDLRRTATVTARKAAWSEPKMEERTGSTVRTPGFQRSALRGRRRSNGEASISDVRAAGVDEDDRAGYWERPSLIFFAEKNRGAEAELLASLAWRGEAHGNDMASGRKRWRSGVSVEKKKEKGSGGGGRRE
jgi:hypothetical protein